MRVIMQRVVLTAICVEKKVSKNHKKYQQLN